jgi:predicted small lipoprotein YifL
LAVDRLSAPIALAAAIAAAFALSSCGRNGGPQLPPQTLTEPTSAAPGTTTPAASAAATGDPLSVAGTTAAQNGFDANGNPKAPTGQKRPFLLDPILQ